ncbi:MAG: FAD-dependent monooxygenase, partial [Actinobacteria bacterium]|nr:FAD-dependent monooxygenase [Actinomycetota bacterium]
WRQTARQNRRGRPVAAGGGNGRLHHPHFRLPPPSVRFVTNETLRRRSTIPRRMPVNLSVMASAAYAPTLERWLQRLANAGRSGRTLAAYRSDLDDTMATIAGLQRLVPDRRALDQPVVAIELLDDEGEVPRPTVPAASLDVDPEEAGGPFRVVLEERHAEHTSEPTLQDLSEALIVAYGTDFGVHTPSWISRFTDMARQAASYRHGRVLLAGDAAHVHPPHGGQGLNTGVQDAVNLRWKLAQVVNETSPESLLDTYHAERHPVGARVLHNTMAQVALSSPDDRHQALRDTMTQLLGMDEPRRHIAAMLSGLDIHYDLGEGHPLLGRRMPDLDVHTADGPTRVFTLLHDARPVLLNLGEPGGFDISPWADRVRLVDARHDGVWELPVLGEIAAPPAVLIRPDGHVAWAGDLTDPELPRALATWFGGASIADGAAGQNSSARSEGIEPPTF